MFTPLSGRYSHLLLASPFGGGQEIPVWVQPQSPAPPSYVITPYSPYKLPSSWPLPSLFTPDTGTSSSRIGRPAPLILDTWDQTNLARRPRDWRVGYNPRGSFFSSLLQLSSFPKNQSDIQGDNPFSDTTRKISFAHHRIFRIQRPNKTSSRFITRIRC